MSVKRLGRNDGKGVKGKCIKSKSWERGRKKMCKDEKLGWKDEKKGVRYCEGLRKKKRGQERQTGWRRERREEG